MSSIFFALSFFLPKPRYGGELNILPHEDPRPFLRLRAQKTGKRKKEGPQKQWEKTLYASSSHQGGTQQTYLHLNHKIKNPESYFIQEVLFCIFKPFYHSFFFLYGLHLLRFETQKPK